VDVLLRANQARRVLFVADRDPLVQQALTDGFQKFLPDEPRTRIHSHNIERTNRLYVVTLQTLSNCFQEFTPGFFDAIFFDEVHRSIFNKWNEVLLYFDAHMIGLTATPAEFLDRNTFREFDCEGNRLTSTIRRGPPSARTPWSAGSRRRRWRRCWRSPGGWKCSLNDSARDNIGS
jgi:type I restriction enzyme, R subunit